MVAVLVVNSGSSSLKYQLIEMDTERVLGTGLVERIGEAVAKYTHTNEIIGAVDSGLSERIADHEDAFARMLESFHIAGPDLTEYPIAAVGHRVVHGGQRFYGPTIVTASVKQDVEDLCVLAPLHNPANLAGIIAAEAAFPGVPAVVVADTAFHATLPAESYRYAIDRELADRFRIRRYGFHGTSHRFVAHAAADFLGRRVEDLNQIVLHLGNGASAAAIRGGESIDTSMGFTPLAGLVMGTRSGDIDPAVLIHLARVGDFSFGELDTLLNRRSGLLGLSGVADMRDVDSRADAGDEAAIETLAIYRHRVREYLGAYLVELGRVDTIIFTAGVGENSPETRAGVLEHLQNFGIDIDPELNAVRGHEVRRISTPTSAITVLVVPTNEELEIARQTVVALAE